MVRPHGWWKFEGPNEPGAYPNVPAWRMSNPHYRLFADRHSDWREGVQAEKRHSGRVVEVIRRARVKQRRLDRHLCDQTTGEWDE